MLNKKRIREKQNKIRIKLIFISPVCIIPSDTHWIIHYDHMYALYLENVCNKFLKLIKGGGQKSMEKKKKNRKKKGVNNKGEGDRGGGGIYLHFSN